MTGASTTRILPGHDVLHMSGALNWRLRRKVFERGKSGFRVLTLPLSWCNDFRGYHLFSGEPGARMRSVMFDMVQEICIYPPDRVE